MCCLASLYPSACSYKIKSVLAMPIPPFPTLPLPTWAAQRCPVLPLPSLLAHLHPSPTEHSHCGQNTAGRGKSMTQEYAERVEEAESRNQFDWTLKYTSENVIADKWQVPAYNRGWREYRLRGRRRWRPCVHPPAGLPLAGQWSRRGWGLEQLPVHNQTWHPGTFPLTSGYH